MIALERSFRARGTESICPHPANVTFRRTKDYHLVRNILAWPDLYPLMGDDSLPPIDEFQVNEHPDIWYVLVSNGGILGLFSLIPQNMVSFELHVTMLPWAKPREKWAAARELAPWLASNTRCRRLTAAVPANNKRALIYGTHGIGMKYVGRQKKAFMKDGILRDLILLGRPVQEVEAYRV